ncbi:MAG: hypothetical protein JSW68_01720, partial [Burkholderiales bacterium]
IGGPVSILIDTPLPIVAPGPGPSPAGDDSEGGAAGREEADRPGSGGTVAADAGSDDPISTPGGPGTVGRALVLARATIERAGGLIEAEMPAAGRGARLRITLPEAG